MEEHEIEEKKKGRERNYRMDRWLLLTFFLLAGLIVIAYPRLPKRHLHYQSHKAAVATVAWLGAQPHNGDLIFQAVVYQRVRL